MRVQWASGNAKSNVVAERTCVRCVQKMRLTHHMAQHQSWRLGTSTECVNGSSNRSSALMASAGVSMVMLGRVEAHGESDAV